MVKRRHKNVNVDDKKSQTSEKIDKPPKKVIKIRKLVKKCYTKITN